MRTFIKNYLAAEKARREENGDAGFSLIELIVVVVILGILAAIAVPVFLGLQGQAEQSALESVVANAASQVASDIAQGADAVADIDLSSLENQNAGDGLDLVVSIGGTDTDLKIDNYCVSGTTTSITTAVTSGPGC